MPISLGDSLGWQHENDIFSVGMLVIPTGVGDQFFSQPLRLPDHLLADAARFDNIVEALVTSLALRRPGKSTGSRMEPLAVSP